ncbi:MAG: ABC transporter ATP-binding protein [Holosporaceae bacterium]|jgi:lipoprotein-releasing system ATP-binding protein|nr:ABC transporter ATP-binding protein [Holosporaceae bacterium]
MNSVLAMENISKQYNHQETPVLKCISLEIQNAEIVALLGPSGSGKSTLLHIAGLLDSASSGNLFVEGRDCNTLSDNEKTRLRLSKIGFIYQYHHLLQEFSALENVVLPQLINGVGKSVAAYKAERLLVELGLEEKINSRPSELSGGQKQRVAIARALANDPLILLADEPTGNLDPETAATVFDDLIGVAEKIGMAAIIVTHNHVLAEKTMVKYFISDGVLRQR